MNQETLTDLDQQTILELLLEEETRIEELEYGEVDDILTQKLQHLRQLIKKLLP